MNILKRHRLASGLLTVAVFGLASTAHGQELILSGFGGAYNDALTEIVQSFEDEHNVEVSVIPGSGADNIARVRNKEIDVIVSDPVFALRMEMEGAFAELDPEIVTNVRSLHPKAIYSDAVVAENFGAYVIAYDPEDVDPPTSWYDLAKPEFQGLVGTRDFRPENIELITLFAKLEGGDERDPDAGFEQMAKIAENVNVFIGSHPDHLELYRNDQVEVSIWTDGRIAWANGEGVNVEGVIPEEGFFPLVSTLSVVDGREHTDLALQLVNHLLSPEAGIIMADRLGYFPTNMATDLPPEIAEKTMLTRENVDDLQTADWRYIVSVYDEWQARWEREVVR